MGTDIIVFFFFFLGGKNKMNTPKKKKILSGTARLCFLPFSEKALPNILIDPAEARLEEGEVDRRERLANGGEHRALIAQRNLTLEVVRLEVNQIGQAYAEKRGN